MLLPFLLPCFSLVLHTLRNANYALGKEALAKQKSYQKL